MNTATTTTPPAEILAHQAEIDLRAEQDEDEQAHDEGRGCDDIRRAFAASPGSILKPNESLLPSMMPNTNTAMKPRGLHAVGGEIGADHGGKRHDRRVFREERPALVRDQQRGEIAEDGAGDDADRRLA